MANPISKTNSNYQKWSPRGHILKSLASKVKSLAFTSKPQVLENCLVLGREQYYFWKCQYFAGKRQYFGGKPCGKFAETFFVSFCFCCWRLPKKILKKTFFIFLWRSYENFFQSFFFQVHLRLLCLVLGFGLEHSFSWPCESLSSKS